MIAIGYLLEAYYHVRAAAWTAAPVLSHPMTDTQRDMLDRFYVDERGHSRSLIGSLIDLGIDDTRLPHALPSPETELFERYLYSCAVRSPLEFAAAIIIPEVEEFSVIDAGPDKTEDLMDYCEKVQGLPLKVLNRFRAHDRDNRDLEHETLPVRLIAERQVLTKTEALSLFSTLDQAIEAYRLLLDGVVRRYEAISSVDELLKESSDLI